MTCDAGRDVCEMKWVCVSPLGILLDLWALSTDTDLGTVNFTVCSDVFTSPVCTLFPGHQ